MYAVVMIGGKQHRVQQGDMLRVEKIQGDVGAAVLVEGVLMIGGEAPTQIGRPFVPGASVEAQIVGHGRTRKLRVYKKKRRKNYQRMLGHRQPFTNLKITGITVS